ncbi:MAG: hypothetical protein LKE37_03335 [Atopobiaceae bacterium]|jgi:hypothetical protein|nr:hypothetical protein [Atopobiaceae bacterium]
MAMGPIETRARGIAARAHAGQVDKAGADYLGHPAHVASLVATDEERACAWLHDVVEDTPTTLDDLRRAGIPDGVVAAVDAMTHRPGEGYLADYVPRVCEDAIAREVKLADLSHNMDLSRLPEVTPRDLGRVERYRAARRLLLDAGAGGDFLLERAHHACSRNREAVGRSERCACFACGEAFPATAVTRWAAMPRDAAICPRCGVDAVIPEAAGFPLTGEFLHAMASYWLSIAS